MNEDDDALISVDWDARFQVSVDAWRAKQAEKKATRQEFADARTVGLRRRHAQKLSRIRNQRETTEQE